MRRMYKLIRRYDVSDAAVHDSQKLDGLLNEANTSADVFADSAYRSAETKAGLKARGFRSRIHVPRDTQSSALAAAGGSEPEEEPRPSSHRTHGDRHTRRDSTRRLNQSSTSDQSEIRVVSNHSGLRRVSH